VKDWDKFRTPSLCSYQVVSVCWVAHGTLTIFYCYCFVEMTAYSFALEIKFVPTLYFSTSSAEYYDWEDTMEDFLWDCGLECRIKILFCKVQFFC
jgi:hypothetical protein